MKQCYIRLNEHLHYIYVFIDLIQSERRMRIFVINALLNNTTCNPHQPLHLPPSLITALSRKTPIVCGDYSIAKEG